jgi:hypothetical protein
MSYPCCVKHCCRPHRIRPIRRVRRRAPTINKLLVLGVLFLLAARAINPAVNVNENIIKLNSDTFDDIY